jgi:hypothetical protein
MPAMGKAIKRPPKPTLGQSMRIVISGLTHKKVITKKMKSVIKQFSNYMKK